MSGKDAADKLNRIVEMSKTEHHTESYGSVGEWLPLSAIVDFLW